jgi:hypothetical protein
MLRPLVHCSPLVLALAGCAVEEPVSARFGELSLCNDSGGLDPECTGMLTSTGIPESSTGGASGTTYPDLPSPGDPTYVDPTYGTTYIDPTYADPTYGTTYVDPTYPDPTYVSSGTTYVDPTYPDPTYGSSGTTYVDPTYPDPSGGTSGATYDPTGMTTLTDPGGSTTYDTGDESGTDTDDTTGAPPNTCSDHCPFAPGEGLPAMVPPGSKLPFVAGCAENGAPATAPTSAIVRCLSNLACHLGRNPTKAEGLEALGVGRDKSMLGSNVIFSASSASGQPIPNALNDKPEGVRAVRSISSPFFEGAPWCSFTSLADDNTFECMNIGFFAPPSESCGTEPIGIKFDELCEKLDEATTTPASDGVFTALAETGVDGGQDSCTVCHDAMDNKKAKNGKQCYFFPIAGPIALCPLRALAATCDNEGDTATCADQSEPSCPSVTQIEGATATCDDGKAATCPGPKNAICKVNPGVYGTNQNTPTAFKDGSLCTVMAQIAKNAKKEIEQGPSLPWTDTTFVDAYLAAYCKEP